MGHNGGDKSRIDDAILPVAERDKRLASLTVAGHATDVEEASMLLAMLGLLVEEEEDGDTTARGRAGT